MQPVVYRFCSETDCLIERSRKYIFTRTELRPRIADGQKAHPEPAADARTRQHFLAFHRHAFHVQLGVVHASGGQLGMNCGIKRSTRHSGGCPCWRFHRRSIRVCTFEHRACYQTSTCADSRSKRVRTYTFDRQLSANASLRG
jgi:hypothetical protein